MKNGSMWIALQATNAFVCHSGPEYTPESTKANESLINQKCLIQYQIKMQDLELYLYLHYILLTDRFSVALIPEKLNENAEKSCLTM